MSDARFAGIEARLAVLEAKLANGGAVSAPSSGAVASDDDLDSEWGDEVVKKDPTRWAKAGKPSFAGCRMSECPSDFLRSVASQNDWIAEQDEAKNKVYVDKNGVAKPTAPFARKRAARARGWAKRNEGKVAAEPHDDYSFNHGANADSDMGF